MDPELIVEELILEVERIRGDIEFMETGAVKFVHNDVDVTADWIQRQKRTADHLEQLASAYRLG
jgi:hypothetical protein